MPLLLVGLVYSALSIPSEIKSQEKDLGPDCFSSWTRIFVYAWSVVQSRRHLFRVNPCVYSGGLRCGTPFQFLTFHIRGLCIGMSRCRCCNETQNEIPVRVSKPLREAYTRGKVSFSYANVCDACSCGDEAFQLCDLAIRDSVCDAQCIL